PRRPAPRVLPPVVLLALPSPRRVRLATVPDLVLVAGRPFVLVFSHPVGRRVRRLRRPQPFEPEQVPSATTPVECEEEERAEEPEDDGMTQEVGPAVPFPDGLPP